MNLARKDQIQQHQRKNLDLSPAINKRILVVDDELSIAEGIRSLLIMSDQPARQQIRSSRNLGAKVPNPLALSQTNESYEVVVITNPTQALIEIEKSIDANKPFAMGFFDVMLGSNIDGIELVKRIQALDSEIFAVFVTAYNDRSISSISEVLGSGNSARWDYINKPFNDSEIIQKARNMTALWNLNRMKEWQEQKLNEAQQLLIQNDRISTVSAVGRSIAHEFGNFLMQIIGNAELGLRREDIAETKKSLQLILKASTTAAAILKKFKKFNAGDNIQNNYQYMCINQTIDEALDIMSFQFRRHSIVVEKESWPETNIEANHSSLIQVFINLFINALHAMNDGGQLKISINSSAEFENSTCIKIQDTGTGIPVDILDRVTEPLFTTKGSNGSGLGLSICKEIIEMEHFGDFKISNRPEGGVEVLITLPIKQEVIENE